MVAHGGEVRDHDHGVRSRRPDGKRSRNYLAQGAGNVRPDRMFNPGVIFDSGEQDWLSFLAGEGFDTDTGIAAIDPSDYNSPSIAIGKLVGSQTVTRKLTAVKAGSYRTTISVHDMTTVSPSIISFSYAGETKTVDHVDPDRRSLLEADLRVREVCRSRHGGSGAHCGCARGELRRPNLVGLPPERFRQLRVRVSWSGDSSARRAGRTDCSRRRSTCRPAFSAVARAAWRSLFAC